jgi:hypothetical protein
MKHLGSCVLTLMLFCAVSLVSVTPLRAAGHTHGVILSDGPMPYPGPIPPVRD